MEYNNKPFIITIVILIIVCLGLGGYIAYEKIMLNKQNNKKETVIDDVSIDLNALYQVGDTLNTFDETFNTNNSNYFGYIYKNDKLYASKFDMGAAIFSAMHSDFVKTNSAEYLVGGRVKNNFEKIFGKNLQYKPVQIKSGANYNIMYNEANTTYTYTATTTNDIYSSGYIAYNVKTQLDDDKILINRRIFYIEYDNASSGTVTTASIYKNADKKKLLGKLNLRNNVLNEDEVIGKYGSSLNEYLYTFIQNNSSDDYSFYSIELVK